MNPVIHWSQQLALVAPHAPAGKTGRAPFATEAMLRIHLLQQFFGHSDPAMEEALHDIPLYREFAQLDAGINRLPDESTILCFRHMLEQNDLGVQILAVANAHDVTQAHSLLHGQEEIVFADSGCRGVAKRQEIQNNHAVVDWHIAMMPGNRKALDKTRISNALTDQLEKLKAGIRAKVEHPFRVIKC